MAILATDFWTFKEYLDAKRKLVKTPKKEDVPDYHGPKPTKPDKPATSGDNWSSGVKPKGSPSPYKGPGTDPGQKKGEKGGFADMGDKDLKYEPKAGLVDKAGEGGEKKKSWPNVATVKHAGAKAHESLLDPFLDRTKDMPLPEFAKYVQRQLTEHCGCENKEIPHVVAYTSGPYHPDPIQAIKYVAFLANENQNIMRALLREMKRLGSMDRLLEGLLSIPETYSEIVHHMSVDPTVSSRIVRAMNDQILKAEGVGPPAHRDEVDDEPDPANNAESEPDRIEGEDEPPGDDEEPEEEEGEEDQPEGDTDEPSFDAATGSGGMTPGEGGGTKFAAQNLADAIKKHKEMQQAMSAYMGSY